MFDNANPKWDTEVCKCYIHLAECVPPGVAIKEYDSEKDLLLADIDEDTTVVRLEAGSLLYCFSRTLMYRGTMTDHLENVMKIVGKIRIVLED